jgi:ATP-dependent DNA helicase PIF1
MSLNREQRWALDRFIKGDNLFITGPGGTGKTFLIKEIVRGLKERGVAYQVCAMTGCAAVLLGCGAKTLHSWCGMGLAEGHKDDVVRKIQHNKRTVSGLKKVRVLIVDEVSMLSKKLFEVLNSALKAVRRSSAPFGGVQIIFTGDFFQLPPIGKDEESSKFCFESADWGSVFPWNNCIELTQIFRQENDTYRRILNQVRRGELDEEGIGILQGCLGREVVGETIPTKLFAVRSKTDWVNSRMYDKLEGEEHVYSLQVKYDLTTMVESGKPLGVAEIEKCRALSHKEQLAEAELLANHMNRVEVLRLKKGSRVMCLHNISVEEGICNGSQGIVVDFTGHLGGVPLVRFSNGKLVPMEIVWHQSEEYPCIGVGQIPLCLAWALTIHKIQGATLTMAEMDLGNTVFEYGQTYVALSRIRNLEGLYLSAFQPLRIRANPLVKEFYKQILPISCFEECSQVPTENPFAVFACPSDENRDVIPFRIQDADILLNSARGEGTLNDKCCKIIRL